MHCSKLRKGREREEQARGGGRGREKTWGRLEGEWSENRERKEDEEKTDKDGEEIRRRREGKGKEKGEKMWTLIRLMMQQDDACINWYWCLWWIYNDAIGTGFQGRHCVSNQNNFDFSHKAELQTVLHLLGILTLFAMAPVWSHSHIYLVHEIHFNLKHTYWGFKMNVWSISQMACFQATCHVLATLSAWFQLVNCSRPHYYCSLSN